MNTVIILVGIALISLFLGLIKFGSLDIERGNWERKFAEIWNDFMNFFIAGLIGYYFVSIRWSFLSNGEALNTSDLVLSVIFMFGVFGHLCVISHNITEGIESIIKRFLKKE